MDQSTLAFSELSSRVRGRSSYIAYERIAHTEVLKLSVNGAELRTLQGARKLLNRRNVCLVLMHAFKAPRCSVLVRKMLSGAALHFSGIG